MAMGKRDAFPRTLADCMSYPLGDARDAVDKSTRHLGLEDYGFSQTRPEVCDRSSPFTSRGYLWLWGSITTFARPFCVRPNSFPRLLLGRSKAVFGEVYLEQTLFHFTRQSYREFIVSIV